MRKLPRGIYVRNAWYWIRYADQHGKIHREKASPLLEGAKSALAKRRTQVKEAKFFPELIRQRSVLFGPTAAEYMRLAKRRKRSWQQDQDHVDNVLPALRNEPLSELTPGRLESVLGGLAEARGWKPATFNRHRSTLSAIFEHAVRCNLTDKNPARHVAHRKEDNQVCRYLSDEEESSLMAVLKPARQTEVLVAIHSGMRRSEQYRTHHVPDGGLRWDHVNLQVGVIRLPRSKPGKPREIPMNPVLREALRSLPRRIDSTYVFSSTDPYKWFAKACKKAGIHHCRWHDLRHTFGSRLAMAGVPMRVIAELMGHSELQTTMRYAHLAPRYLADAVARLTDTAADTGRRKANERWC